MNKNKDPYVSAKRFFEKSRMRYGGRIIASIGVVILGVISTFYLNSLTNRLEQNLDITPKVISKIQGEDGEISQSELQDFIKYLRIGYRIKEGDKLNLRSQYRSQIEVIIISGNNKKKIGETDRFVLTEYLKRPTN